jgi:ribosomal protein S15P/S13E
MRNLDSMELEIRRLDDRATELFQHMETHPNDRQAYQAMLSALSKKRSLCKALLGLDRPRHDALMQSLVGKKKIQE